MPFDQWQPPSVTATVFDLSDRSAPAVVQESLIDGSYVDARQIGDELIIVVRKTGYRRICLKSLLVIQC